MPVTSDFTVDNLGPPDKYTVQKLCRRIRVREKDRSASPQASFNVYLPADGVKKPFAGGEEFIYDVGLFIEPGTKPFAMETISVAAAVFSAVEE